MIDLSIIIVSYNTRKLLSDCLTSVLNDLKRSSLKAEIIVVDNASCDGSRQMLEKFRVNIIENNNNIGFGRANNQGAKISKGRYLLFLNSDTIVEGNSLLTMIRFMDADPKIGIASCQLKNSDGSIQSQGGYLPRLSTVAIWALFLDDLPFFRQILPSYQFRGNIKKIREIGWVGGTAMFVRKKCWDNLKGFDEKIFMYGEDVELCYRARKNNWKITLNPETSIIHLGGGSGKGQVKWITGEIQGLTYFFSKHKPVWEFPILKLIVRIGMAMRWLIFGIIGNNADFRRAYKEAMEMV